MPKHIAFTAINNIVHLHVIVILCSSSQCSNETDIVHLCNLLPQSPNQSTQRSNFNTKIITLKNQLIDLINTLLKIIKPKIIKVEDKSGGGEMFKWRSTAEGCGSDEQVTEEVVGYMRR